MSKTIRARPWLSFNFSINFNFDANEAMLHSWKTSPLIYTVVESLNQYLELPGRTIRVWKSQINHLTVKNVHFEPILFISPINLWISIIFMSNWYLYLFKKYVDLKKRRKKSKKPPCDQQSARGSWSRRCSRCWSKRIP